MIDWFASKIGMLVFIAAALSILMIFSSMQLNVMDYSKKVAAANDLARLSDGLCEGCIMLYEFERNYTVTPGESNITIDGITRATMSDIIGSRMNVKAVVMLKSGGYVMFYAA